MTDRDLSAMGSLTKILDTLSQGVAIFNTDRKLLYTNPAMKVVTGGRNGTGWSLNDLIQKHQLRTESGEIYCRTSSLLWTHFAV